MKSCDLFVNEQDRLQELHRNILSQKHRSSFIHLLHLFCAPVQQH